LPLPEEPRLGEAAPSGSHAPAFGPERSPFLLGRRATLLGAVALLAASPARLVLAASDDELNDAIQKVWGAPFSSLTHATVTFSADPFDADRVADMVDDDNTVWDICRTGAGTCSTLGRAGLLEMLDWSVIDRRSAPSGFVIPWWGIPAYLTSLVIAFDRIAVGPKPPQSWAEFWDTGRFPGKRAVLADGVAGVCESVLLADGVAADRLFPLDLDRAFARLAALRPQLVLCASAAEARTALQGGAAPLGLLRNTTAYALRQNAPGRFDWSWNQAILTPCLFVVPKGNPAGPALAMRFIASTQLPDRQTALLRLAGCGPANPEARARLPSDLVPLDPGSAENLRVGVRIDQDWYNANEAALAQRWHAFITA